MTFRIFNVTTNQLIPGTYTKLSVAKVVAEWMNRFPRNNGQKFEVIYA